MTLAIIDGDTICYMAAGACQKKDLEGEVVLEPVANAYSNAKNKILQILKNTYCSDYRLFLTQSADSESFRLKIFPDYKANRKDKEKPHYLKDVRQYLIDHWKAEVVGSIEADDAVCMVQHKEYKGIFQEAGYILDVENVTYPAILCGIDKDLDQIPGWHYNYNKNVIYHVTEIEGLRSMYLQMLTGDTSDNIPRIKKGWRQKQYETELQSCTKESEMYKAAIKHIESVGIPEGYKTSQEYLNWVGNLVYLRKHEEDAYYVPELVVE